jgi:3-oxoacyl-[acyl-carrier protein] reductase
MELGLEGKNIVVTASSKGIGLAIAEQLAAEGANLLLCSRNLVGIKDIAARLAEEHHIQAFGIQVDVASASQIEHLTQFASERFQAVHGLVCNTGGPPSGKFMDMNDDHWEQAYQSILMSVVRLVRGLYPLLQIDGGRVLTVASSSVKEPISGLVLSNVYRAGLAGLMKTLSLELAQDNILLNTICPGRIETDRLHELDEAKAAREGRDVQEIKQEAMRHIPLGRYGRPEEFADLATYLLSPRNSYLTGSIYYVDGGSMRSL